MIPSRELDPELLEILRQLKVDITYQDVMYAFMLIAMERNFGNKMRTSRELKVPIRTLRNRLHNIESLGYDVCPYDSEKQVRVKRVKRVRKVKS
jgi:hypothetical protein